MGSGWAFEWAFHLFCMRLLLGPVWMALKPWPSPCLLPCSPLSASSNLHLASPHLMGALPLPHPHVLHPYPAPPILPPRPDPPMPHLASTTTQSLARPGQSGTGHSQDHSPCRRHPIWGQWRHTFHCFSHTKLHPPRLDLFLKGLKCPLSFHLFLHNLLQWVVQWTVGDEMFSDLSRLSHADCLPS